MHNLSDKDQLQFIKLCMANPNVESVDKDFFCNHYEDECDRLYYLNKILISLGIQIEIQECNCEFLATYWPTKAIDEYRVICRKR